jgi:DNA-binding SARP family transcriptional activator
VLNRDRVIARETLAETLWAEHRGDVRKTLRQALWQVQSALSSAVHPSTVQADNEFVGLHPNARIDADVSQIEAAHQLLHVSKGDLLNDAVAAALRDASSLYRGDLLTSSYTNWCLVGRERFRAMYLAILEKLMANAEATENIDEGLWYGEQILRHHRTSEHTHRRLMALRYLSGDRTGAMRQYKSCARALAEDLDVGGTRHAGARRPDPQTAPHPRPCAALDVSRPRRRAEPVPILRDIHDMLLDACDQIASALVALGDDGRDVHETAERWRGDRAGLCRSRGGGMEGHPEAHSFVLRIWLEDPPTEGNSVRWRGRITNVLDERSRVVQEFHHVEHL